MRPAVFLDRDDTLIACNGLPEPRWPALPGDLIDPAAVRLLPGVLEGCRRLVRAGYELVVVTNQGGVARGAISTAGVEGVNDRVRAALRDEGRELLTAVYFCPFHPRPFHALKPGASVVASAGVARFVKEHAWRKPSGGMIRAAAAELHVDLERSWLIGDAERDIECGVAGGLDRARCVRVGTPSCPDFAAAAALVLRSSR